LIEDNPIYINEKELLQRIAIGDEKAFRKLFDYYWPRMYANALKFTKSPEQAQDVGQEIFIKVWTNRQKLINIERFDAYLYRIAKNTIYDYFDSKTLAVENEAFLAEYFEDASPLATENLEAKELERIISEAIINLPEQVRTAFQLSRREGLSHTQISEKMGISKISSKSYISRAILAIKARLAGRAIALFFTLTSHFLAFCYAQKFFFLNHCIPL
jgi:RNA polymerase sigma-70 factor (family 1)